MAASKVLAAYSLVNCGRVMGDPAGGPKVIDPCLCPSLEVSLEYDSQPNYIIVGLRSIGPFNLLPVTGDIARNTQTDCDLAQEHRSQSCRGLDGFGSVSVFVSWMEG